MGSEYMKSMKLELELLGPHWWEESKISYKDVMDVYNALIDEGVERDCIDLNFRTDSYSCTIKNSEVHLEGKIEKKINVQNRNTPPLEEFLSEPVKELNVNITSSTDPFLRVSVKKDGYPDRYKVEAYLKNLDGSAKLLETLAGQLRKGMIMNSDFVKSYY